MTDGPMPPADIVRAIRAAGGMSMMQAKAAMQLADARFGGDYVLTALMHDAHGLAVNVGSRNPAVSDAEARMAWDVAMARSRRDAMTGDAWDALRRISKSIHQGEPRR